MLQECSYRNVHLDQILASLYTITWKGFFVLLNHNSKLEMKATWCCMSDEQFHNSKALFSWLRWFNLLHGNGYLWSLIYVNVYLWSLIYGNGYLWSVVYGNLNFSYIWELHLKIDTFENKHIWNLNTLLHYTLPFLTGLMLWLEDSFYRLGYRGACYLLKYIAMLTHIKKNVDSIQLRM